ncbi:MAG TPA: tetratricopeptide repeat protein [Kofleriaceae bacterium]|jgi:hypothetical protein
MRLAILAILALAVPAAAAPHKKPPKPTKQQREADRLFKNGVALFDQQKFSEALAEFQRAYEIAPAPIVLYNIAACYRELSQYGDAVTFYQRFLSEGAGKVPATRLSAAKTELDGILAHTAHVTVNITPQDAQLILDGNTLDPPIPTPLILAPGEHKLTAHVDGKQDATKVIRVASGDEPTVELVPAAPREKPPEPQPVHAAVTEVAPPPEVEPASRFVRVRLGAAYGTNLAQTRVTGAPEVGLGVGLGSRVEIGVDVLLVAYAVIPSLRVRLVGDRVSLHLIAAAPIAIETGAMSTTFVAGAGGLGVRWHVTPSIGLHLEGYASYATSGHGTTFPAFLGGDVWF